MIFTVADHDFVNPFPASTEEEAAEKAIKIMGFGHETRDRVERNGALIVLSELGFKLEIL